MENEVLSVNNLNIALKDRAKIYPAVDDFSLHLQRGKTAGIIGESGSGKSLSCMALMGLLQQEKWQYSGEVLLNGQRLPVLDNNAMASYRGNSIAAIMQNPVASFDMVYTIRHHFEETMRAHDKNITKREIKSRALNMLRQMHIRDPEAVYESYPFQCSGGMLQRIMIAIAVVQNPDVLIADEPTTALDLTIQHQIIQILGELQEKYNTSIVLVSHDLGVIEHLADDIIVMYSGRIVECGQADVVMKYPVHPYTKALFASRPSFSKEKLHELPGSQLPLTERTRCCQFYSRCPLADKACLTYDLSEKQSNGHMVRCCKCGG